MGLLEVLRAGVKVADKITKPLQADVIYERYVENSDGYGTPGYEPATTMKALIEWKQIQVRQQDGVLSVTRASLTLIDVAEVAEKTSGQGIDDHDKFTLPDGTTGPILDMGGFIDAGTGQPFATEILLG